MVGFIRRFYVIEDLQASKYNLKEFSELDTAYSYYDNLPETKMKALGVESKCGALDFIQCVEGKNKLTKDYEKLARWKNSKEIKSVVEELKKKLCESLVQYALLNCNSASELREMELEP